MCALSLGLNDPFLRVERGKRVMGYSLGNLAMTDRRAVHRDEVHHRINAIRSDDRPLAMLIVNISSHGLMARCDHAIEPGDHIRLTLPLVGECTAEIRWALGGRFGGHFTRPLSERDYHAMLAQLTK